ncbi:unnamed protein product [Amoebophrya sp. A120]|nr:unnamed protein product [Amoebophrya sp. A120]|eukprot:GSA120T00013170001.1
MILKHGRGNCAAGQYYIGSRRPLQHGRILNDKSEDVMEISSLFVPPRKIIASRRGFMVQLLSSRIIFALLVVVLPTLQIGCDDWKQVANAVTILTSRAGEASTTSSRSSFSEESEQVTAYEQKNTNGTKSPLMSTKSLISSWESDSERQSRDEREAATSPLDNIKSSLLQQQGAGNTALQQAAIEQIRTGVDPNLYEWTENGYCSCQGNFCPTRFANGFGGPLGFANCQRNCTENPACMGFAYSGNCVYSVQHKLVDGVIGPDGDAFLAGPLLSDPMNRLRGDETGDDWTKRLRMATWIRYGCVRKILKPETASTSRSPQAEQALVSKYRSVVAFQGLCGCGPLSVCKTKRFAHLGLHSSQLDCERLCEEDRNCAAYQFGVVSEALGRYHPHGLNYNAKIAGTCRLYESTWNSQTSTVSAPDRAFGPYEIYNTPAGTWYSDVNEDNVFMFPRKTDDDGKVLEIDNFSPVEDFWWVNEFCMKKMPAGTTGTTNANSNGKNTGEGFLANANATNKTITGAGVLDQDALTFLDCCFYGTIVIAVLLTLALVFVLFLFRKELQQLRGTGKQKRRGPAAQRWRHRSRAYAKDAQQHPLYNKKYEQVDEVGGKMLKRTTAVVPTAHHRQGRRTPSAPRGGDHEDHHPRAGRGGTVSTATLRDRRPGMNKGRHQPGSSPTTGAQQGSRRGVDVVNKSAKKMNTGATTTTSSRPVDALSRKMVLNVQQEPPPRQLSGVSEEAGNTTHAMETTAATTAHEDRNVSIPIIAVGNMHCKSIVI